MQINNFSIKLSIFLSLIILMLLPQIIYSYEEKYIQIEGQKIFYITAGDGSQAPLIIIPGLGMTAKFWTNNIDAFANKRKIYAIDLPGFGHSQKDKKDYSINFYIKFLNKFLTQQKITRAIFLGHSIGGTISILYSIQYPNQVEKLILVDSDGIKNENSDSFLNLLRMPIIGDIIFIMRDKDMIRKSLKKDIFFNPNFITEQLVDEVGHGSRNIFLLLVRSFKNLTEELNKIKCPVLIIWGEKDKLYPVDNAHIFNEKIIDSHLVVFSESGVCPNIEKSETFNDTVIRFIENKN